MRTAFVSTAVQLLLMIAVAIVTVYLYQNGSSAGWIYIVGGIVVGFALYSFSDNILQKLMGDAHLITIKDNVLSIQQLKTGTTITEGKMRQYGLDTKANHLRGGKVKHINIKRKDFEMTLIDTWVKSHDKDMADFLKWHKKIEGK